MYVYTQSITEQWRGVYYITAQCTRRRSGAYMYYVFRLSDDYMMGLAIVLTIPHDGSHTDSGATVIGDWAGDR